MAASVASTLAQFRAVYCSGMVIPDPAEVSALALLFEKVHLPNNVELIREFSKRYRVRPASKNIDKMTINIESVDGENPFSDLPPEQYKSALHYVAWGMSFAHRYSPLFGEVFESELFPDNQIVNVELIKKGALGEKNTYAVTFSNKAQLSGGDEEYFPRLLEEGYVPVVGRLGGANELIGKADGATAKQLATMLAMKSVQMVLPRMKAANPELLLEARERLKDQLPPFWSSMLKTSVELKKIISDCPSHCEISREASDLVDRLIRPAVIDLSSKLESERKDWFYKILSPIRSGIRIFVGNPPLTQQQLITNAMVLASDTCAAVAENMRAIDALKREAGLAYLLDLSDLVTNTEK